MNAHRARCVLCYLLFWFKPFLCSQNLQIQRRNTAAATLTAGTEGRAHKHNILEPKIAGGTDAPAGRFPYMCSLRKRGSQKHMCGGTLIEKTWVLTAAHCLTSKSGRALGFYPIVDCGIYYVDVVNDSLTFAAIDFRVHDEWSGMVSDGFDVAMLKLNREANLVSPQVGKKSVELRQGDYLAAIGWGATKAEKTADTLQIAQQLVYISQENCERVLQMKLKEHMICAGMLDQDTCKGDSGGPLFVASAPKGNVTKGLPSLDLLVGITSAGRGHKSKDGSYICDGSTPGVYTNVSFFWDWISENIKMDNETLLQGKSWTEEIEGLRERYRHVTYDDMVLEMINAIRSDDPLKADSLLLAGVKIDERYSNYRMHNDVAPGSFFLHWAAAFDSIQCAKILLRARAELDAFNYMGESPLYTAASCGSNNVAKSGSKPDQPTEDWKTPLHAAASHGHLLIVEMLIEEGVDLEPKDQWGKTPLHLASVNGSAEIVEELVSRGVAVDARTNDGKTPLLLAAEYGRLEVVQALIAEGANASVADNRGRTSLIFAADQGHLEVVQVLILNGVDVSARDEDGTTALLAAAEGGHLEILKELIENGANASATDSDGFTPLYHASKRGRVDVVRELISMGASVNAADPSGKTPLHAASVYGHFDVVQELLASGADPNAADKDGSSPLLVASQYGHLEIVEVLLEREVDVNATDSQGKTALILASWYGKMDVVEELLARGADVDAATKTERATALHKASDYKRVEVLIAHGADANKRDVKGQTPLHIASLHGYVDAVKALVEGKADKTVKNNEGETALDVVCSYAFAECPPETKITLEELLSP